MYNEEIKNRFIDYYTNSESSKRVCVDLFNATEAFESSWGSDLCSVGTDDLLKMTESVMGLRTHNKNARFIILKDYSKWCLMSKIQGANDNMSKVNPTGLDKFRKQTVSGPRHLQKYLDMLYDEESMLTTDNIYRCYYWLAFMGVDEEDILRIESSDIDFSTMMLSYEGKELPLYQESIPCFRNCAILDSFIYNHPNYKKVIWRSRAPGDTLVRGIRGIMNIKSLRVEISRTSKAKEDITGMRLSYFRTWLSGIFYRAYQDEIIGEDVDFKEVAERKMKGKTYKLETNLPGAKMRQLMKDYKDDYERWKLAFKI